MRFQDHRQSVSNNGRNKQADNKFECCDFLKNIISQAVHKNLRDINIYWRVPAILRQKLV
jgi:hypothetical protein